MYLFIFLSKDLRGDLEIVKSKLHDSFWGKILCKCSEKKLVSAFIVGFMVINSSGEGFYANSNVKKQSWLFQFTWPICLLAGRT